MSDWTTGPVHNPSGTGVVQLEPPSASWDPYTTTGSFSAGDLTHAVSDWPSGSQPGFEVVIGSGSASDPYEYVLVTGAAAGQIQFIPALQDNHPIGTTISPVTTNGVSNWTFIPVAYLGNTLTGGDTITFSNVTLVVDPR